MHTVPPYRVPFRYGFRRCGGELHDGSCSAAKRGPGGGRAGPPCRWARISYAQTYVHAPVEVGEAMHHAACLL